MKLLTEEIIKRTPKLYETEDIKCEDKIAQARFFDPCGNMTWYLMEMDEKQERCFGYIVGFEAEYGYFLISELEGVKGPLGIGIERDFSFEPTKMGEIMNKNN